MAGLAGMFLNFGAVTLLPLAEATKRWGELTMDIARRAAANPEVVGECATDFLFYSGYVVLAYWHARAAAVAVASGAAADDHPKEA